MTTAPRLFAVLSLSLASLAFALPTHAATTPPATPQVEAVVVADIGIVNLTFSVNGPTIIGAFDLVGRMGQQNGVVLGVVVKDALKVVDAKVIKSDISIKQGELQHYTFSYTLPPSVSGQLTATLEAHSDGGFALDIYPFFQKKPVAGTSLGVLACSPEKGASYSCTSKEAGEVTLSVSEGTVLSKSRVIDTKNLAANTKTTLSGTLPPGKYYTRLTYTKTGESVFFRLTVDGSGASIANVAVSRGVEIGIVEAVITASVVGNESYTASLSLKDSNGARCAEESKPLTSTFPVASFTLTSSCANGTATVTIKDAKGMTIDSSSQPFSIEVVKPGAASSAPSTLSSSWWWTVVLGALLLAGTGWWLLLSRRASDVMPRFEQFKDGGSLPPNLPGSGENGPSAI